MFVRLRGHVPVMNHRTVTRRSECLFINFIQHSAAFTGGYYFQRNSLAAPDSQSSPPKIGIKFIPSGGEKRLGNVAAGMSVSLGRAWGNIRQSRPFASAAAAPTDGIPFN